MSPFAPTRRFATRAAVLFCLAAFSPAALFAMGGWRGGPPMARPRSGASRSTVGPRPGQEHLAQWLNQHQQLSPAEQQRALDREPGFRQLPPEVQQRMHNRLSQLNTMSPAQRQRILNRTEAMERLAPAQRQEIRSSMKQLSSLPMDQRHQVARAFRQYRRLTPDQRHAALSSGQFTATFSPEQRSTFNGLVAVEPLLPPPPSQAGEPSSPPQ